MEIHNQMAHESDAILFRFEKESINSRGTGAETQWMRDKNLPNTKLQTPGMYAHPHPPTNTHS